ncbi:hypothetical protein BH20ACT5_BH20ACT5_06570 [soil metagenome]
MRRTLSLLCAAALTVTGAVLSAPVAAAPSDPSSRPAAAPPSAPGEGLVTYAEGVTSTTRAAVRHSVQASLDQQIVAARADRAEVELLRVPSAARDAVIATLNDHPAVTAAEPNWIYTKQATSTDPFFTDGRLWGMYGDRSSPANQFGSQAAEAWANDVTGSANVYVGVIDEGIQFSHPDLSGQVWTNPHDPVDGIDNDGNGFVDDANGWDFFNDDRTVYDGTQDDHGTHVAGTIGAKANTIGPVGVNWNITMISTKFLGPSGGFTSDAVLALDYLKDLKTRHGLNIVATNNSWGGGGFSQALLDAIGRNATAGILFVAAAGNGGYNNDTFPSYPASYNTTSIAGYDSVIAVAAIDKFGALAGFSQFGQTSVDLGAPGVDVWSTVPNNAYASYNGTSMATPHVTGGLALISSAFPTLPANKLKTALLRYGVTPTASLNGKTVTGGRLDLSRLG